MLTYGVRIIMMGKAKYKPLELPVPSKTVNPKQYHIPGGISESVPKQELERFRGGDLYHIPIQLTYLVCTEERWILYNDSGLSQSSPG